LEGKTKTPAGKAEQVRPRRSVRDGEAHRRPRKAKSGTEINSGSGVSSDPYEPLYSICSTLNWNDFVMA
jgi:hypothetical protein